MGRFSLVRELNAWDVLWGTRKKGWRLWRMGVAMWRGYSTLVLGEDVGREGEVKKGEASRRF
ncbi:hypothetical protein CTI12_AA539450 [Artemisia annua]|uniref:Uncharacterized protein n=1 Tax=Artemisia annua TaxID=35608 RepID=A0A2U1L1V3_ARTAN|nr:hypothetical protein CTI12_AA539450 [Artemisia annua]